MTTHTNSDISEGVYRYVQGCERLLAAADSPRGFTEEELSIIKHYQAAVEKILCVSDASRN